MTTFKMPQCVVCSRFRKQRKDGTGTCSAFPQGIPEPIFPQGRDHRKPWPGDHGLTFLQDPEKEPLLPGLYDEEEST